MVISVISDIICADGNLKSNHPVKREAAMRAKCYGLLIQDTTTWALAPDNETGSCRNLDGQMDKHIVLSDYKKETKNKNKKN